MSGSGQNAETVLVVDDDTLELRLFEALLERAGYHVETASNGHDALESLRTSRPSLVLLDVRLTEELDGIETYRRMLEIRPGQKAVVLTGGAETSQIGELLRLGIKTWARKPVTPRRLEEMVRRELDRDAVPGLRTTHVAAPAW